MDRYLSRHYGEVELVYSVDDRGWYFQKLPDGERTDTGHLNWNVSQLFADRAMALHKLLYGRLCWQSPDDLVRMHNF